MFSTELDICRNTEPPTEFVRQVSVILSDSGLPPIIIRLGLSAGCVPYHPTFFICSGLSRNMGMESKMPYWYAVNLLPILALVSLAIRPTRFAIPWLGLATVVMGTTLAFSSSATFYSDRSIGAGIGWLITSIYGFVGLGIVVAYVRYGRHHSFHLVQLLQVSFTSRLSTFTCRHLLLIRRPGLQQPRPVSY